MKKKSLRIITTIMTLVFLLTGFSGVIPVSAAAPSLDIQGSQLIRDIAAGESYTHTITVTSSTDMELEVEAGGLGQTIDGSTTVLTPAEDNSPYSARTFLTLDKFSLSLTAGEPQEINVVINIPAGTSGAERYAAVYLHQIADPDVTILVAAIVPIVINTPGYTASRTGSITDVEVPTVYKGKPVTFNTTFENTGNCRISNAISIVTLKNSSGSQLWEDETSIGSPSLLPGFPRQISTSYATGLNTGDYTVTSQITLADGTELDTENVSFTVAALPAVPETPTLNSPGESTAPGPYIDTLTPTFQWNAVAEAEYYVLTVSRDPYSTSDVVYISADLTANSFTLPSDILFAGEKYAWTVSAANIAGSSLSSAFYFQTEGDDPIVSTLEADSITATTAVLNGNLDARGGAGSVTVSFEYGTSTSYGSTTDSQTLTAAGAFDDTLTELEPDTTYHYRAKAVGSSTVYGEDQTFTTLSSDIAVTSVAAGSIQSTSAKLNGKLTSLGDDSSVAVGFEYGTSTSYGSTTTSQTKTATGTFSVTVTDLTPGTTYHFRAVAEGTSTVYGDDLTFKTLAATTTTTTNNTAVTTSTTSATTTRANSPPATTITRTAGDYLLPGMDESTLVVFAFNEQAAFASSRDENDLEVTLSGFKGEGIIALARYTEEPALNPAFSDPALDGGTGKPGIKFWDIFVEGVNQGTANVTAYYHTEEIDGIDDESLFLAYYYNGKWHRCSNGTVYAGDTAVTGNIPISRLNGTVIGMGGDYSSQNAGSGAVSQNNNESSTGVPWSMVAMITAPIIIIGGAVAILELNRRKKPAHN